MSDGEEDSEMEGEGEEMREGRTSLHEARTWPRRRATRHPGLPVVLI